MGWLFGRKNKVPKVPLPKGIPIDDKALKLPAAGSSDKTIEPEKLKEAIGFDKPMDFPEEPEQMKEEQEISPKPQQEMYAPRETAGRVMSSPFLEEEGGREELFVKVEVYQKILAEIDTVSKDVSDLVEINKSLETSEYNEKNTFSKLRKTVKSLHDNLLDVDKNLFKT